MVFDMLKFPTIGKDAWFEGVSLYRDEADLNTSVLPL